MTFIIVCLFALAAFPLHGRDLESVLNLYSGPRADLADALTARAHDSSAVYYNPAGLVFMPNQSMSLSSTTIGRFTYSADNTFHGQSYTAEYDKRPFFTSYAYRDPQFAPDFAFGFAIQDSQNMKNNNRSFFSGEIDIEFPSKLPYSTEIFYSDESNHTQFTSAVAYRLTPSIGIGLSAAYGLLSQRNQSHSTSLLRSGITGEKFSWDSYGQSFSSREAKGESFSAQMGTEVDLTHWLQFGAIYRTFSLLTQSSKTENRNIESLVSQNPEFQNINKAAFQDSESNAYPFAYRRHAITLGLSFGNSSDFINTDVTMQSAAHATKEEKHSQLDFGLGAQKNVHRLLSLTSGFRTYFDDNLAVSSAGRRPSTRKTEYLDIYTGSLGLVLQQSSFSLGFTYTRVWGKGQHANNSSIDEPQNLSLRGQSLNVSISSY